MALSNLPVPDPIVRPAVAADRSEILRLLGCAAAELEGRKGAWQWATADADAFGPEGLAERWFARESGLLLIGTLDGVVVGLLSGNERALLDGARLGSLDAVYVEAPARGVGVGDALLVAAVDHFRGLGCVGVDGWALPGERDTKNFFEAHAFTARLIRVHHSFEAPRHVDRHARLRG